MSIHGPADGGQGTAGGQGPAGDATPGPGLIGANDVDSGTPLVHSHSDLISGPQSPARHTPNLRQLAVAVVVAVALIVAAVATFRHFSRPSGEYAGIVEPAQQLDLNFMNAGVIVGIDVKGGDHVKAGQVLARQDPQVAKLAVDADKVNLGADQAKLAMVQSNAHLVQQHNAALVAAAQQDVNQNCPFLRACAGAQAQLAVAQARAALETDPATFADQIAGAQAAIAQDQARLAQDELVLSQQSLVAPMDGVVSEVGGTPGEMASDAGVRNFSGPPAQGRDTTRFNLLPSPPPAAVSTSSSFVPIIRMYQTANWHVVADISENTVASFVTGRTVKVQVPAVSDRWLAGTVDEVVQIPVSVTGVAVNAGAPARYSVRIRLASVPTGVLPGMRSRFRLGPEVAARP